MIPNVPASVQQAQYRTQVWTMLVLGILIDYAAHIVPGSGTSIAGQARAASGRQVNLMGWGVLFVMMTLLTDFDATTELARMFALLILIGALFINGQNALANVQKLIANGTVAKSGAPSTPPPATPGG